VASIGHVAIGVTAARSETERPPWSALVFWSALSLFPDIDVIGFMRGVPYGAPWGHRGATHSLAFAVAGGILVGAAARVSGLAARLLGARGSGLAPRGSWRIGVVATLVLASHGLLDSLTDGGLGVALLWPFSLHRFFAPWQPIPVAPIGPAFFTLDGLTVALSEVALFLPLWLYAFRLRVRPVAIAVWLLLVWLIGSTDPVRERVLNVVMRDSTRFAPGYSEDAFRTVAVGESEDAVRARLGEPLFESLFFLPKGASVRSLMETSASTMPEGCVGLGVDAGVVHDTHDPASCKSRGVVEGTTKAEALSILGPPSASCVEYSRSQGHGRLRMVCFSGGKAEMIFRRRM